MNNGQRDERIYEHPLAAWLAELDADLRVRESHLDLRRMGESHPTDPDPEGLNRFTVDEQSGRITQVYGVRSLRALTEQEAVGRSRAVFDRLVNRVAGGVRVMPAPDEAGYEGEDTRPHRSRQGSDSGFLLDRRRYGGR